MRIHSGEKRFACKQCLKYFSSAASVKQHMRTHSEEKPCSCKHCSRSYSQGGDLKGHMKAHSVVIFFLNFHFLVNNVQNSLQKLKT